MRLKGWFFVLEVDLSTDSHTTLVRWLASKKLSHLFSEENKRISYYSFSRMGREWLIARSSCEIVDPAVWSSEIEIDDAEPVRFFVRVYSGVEISFIQPFLIQAFFNRTWIIRCF